MKTETKKVETYVTRLYCECSKEDVEMDCVTVLTSMPHQYVYQCPKCGARWNSNIQYTSIEYIEV